MNQQPIPLHQLYHKVLNLGHMTLEYADKMVTDLPNTDVVDRRMFILKQCMDKVVLDVGCKGPFHEELKEVTKKCYGIDQEMVKDDPDFLQMVIGKDALPVYEDVQVIVCGEIIEHLINPGLFLQELKEKYPTQTKIISVPNAFAKGHPSWIKKRKENTNTDHVAFYSYVTLKGLLGKCGYEVKEFYWYDNPEHIQVHGLNEGMVAVTT